MRARSIKTKALLSLLTVCALVGCQRNQRLSPPDLTRAGARSAAVTRVASTPVIYDSHVHITPTEESFNLSLLVFSKVGVKKFAVKSAGVPGGLRFEMTTKFAEILGGRMAYFSNVDWEGVDDPGWGKREADRMEKAVKQGARGIKIFKNLGLGVRLVDPEKGKLMRLDDKRLEPIWQRAGKIGAIIAWHVADPVAFFKKPDKNNERYYELSMAPEWSFHGKDYPSHQELLAQRDKVVAAHPRTTFLGIHLANHPEDLDYVARLLDRCPNMYVDTSARLGEIGRHPQKKVRAFFIKYQDRILFGTDFIATPRGLQLGSVSETPPTFKDALRFFGDHRRFFETGARQIDHPTPSQGNWKVHAINLPPSVLSKLYRDNAERLIFAHRSKWLRDRAAKKGSGNVMGK